MKKYVLTLMCAVLLTACGQDKTVENKAASNNALPATQLTKYKVTSYPYTPFVIRDDKGHVDGFETDILLAIAKNQNIQFEFIPLLVKWDLLFNSIEQKQADLLSAGMYSNEERRQRFEVSKPYMHSQFAFLSTAKFQINHLNDLRNKRVAVMENSMAEKEIYALPYSKEIDTMRIKSIYEGVKAVASGQADVLYGDKVVLTYYANQLQDQKLHVSSDAQAEQHEFVFLITKGNTELLNKINTGLTNIQADGTLDQIKKKWLVNVQQ